MQPAPISFAICGLHKFIDLLMEILIKNDDDDDDDDIKQLICKS